MTVYVDVLMNHGWKLRGHPTKNCHMFTAEGYVKLSSKVYHDNDEIAEEYFNNMK